MDALLGSLVALARTAMARDNPTAGRISVAALAGVLAGIAAVASVGCSLTALWFIATPRLGPAWTALVLGGILAALCLALLALAFAMVRRDRSSPRFEADSEASVLAATRLFKEHKGALLMAALVAGLGVGSNGGWR